MFSLLFATALVTDPASAAPAPRRPAPASMCLGVQYASADVESRIDFNRLGDFEWTLVAYTERLDGSEDGHLIEQRKGTWDETRNLLALDFATGPTTLCHVTGRTREGVATEIVCGQKEFAQRHCR